MPPPPAPAVSPQLPALAGVAETFTGCGLIPLPCYSLTCARSPSPHCLGGAGARRARDAADDREQERVAEEEAEEWGLGQRPEPSVAARDRPSTPASASEALRGASQEAGSGGGGGAGPADARGDEGAPPGWGAEEATAAGGAGGTELEPSGRRTVALSLDSACY